jgi:hypothetical protein
MTAIERMGGVGGFEVQSGTSPITAKDYTALVVNADCVFTEFLINGTSVLSTKNMSGVTFKQGTFLPCKAANTITGFTLSSGSVICYLNG